MELNLEYIEKYNEARNTLYKCVKKILDKKVGREIPHNDIDFWSFYDNKLYVEYYDEEVDSDECLLMDINEFFEFVNNELNIL